MNQIDWTRLYEDAIGRADVEFAVPSTPSCLPEPVPCPTSTWQDDVYEYCYPFLDALQWMVDEYRRRYRQPDDSTMIVVIPRWKYDRLSDLDRQLIAEGTIKVRVANHWDAYDYGN